MNEQRLKILVTAAGGDVGQAIVKALRLIDRPIHILGCDVDSEGVGEAFVDEFFTVPSADHQGYLNVINEICLRQNVDAVIPGSEPEIFTVSRAVHQENFQLNAALICQKYSWLSTYGDKLECFRSLSGKVPLVAFADGSDTKEVTRFLAESGFPCVVKSRRSWGSKSFNIVHDVETLTNLITSIPYPLIQQFIDDRFGEYSLGVFAHRNFITAVAFKRILGPVGASWYADNMVQDEDVIKYANSIAEATGLQGSCNVQVRKSSDGVRLLEINPRFSSLVAARAACGFKDLEWSLSLALRQKITVLKDYSIKKVKFRRYLHEMIDFGKGYMCIEEWSPRSQKIKNDK